MVIDINIKYKYNEDDFSSIIINNIKNIINKF